MNANQGKLARPGVDRPKPAMKVKVDRRFEDLVDRHEPIVGGGYRARAHIDEVSDNLASVMVRDGYFDELRFD